MSLVGVAAFTDRSRGEDRCQVTVVETLVCGGVSQSPVDPLCPVESGQGDRFGHLGLDSCRARSCSFDQPETGTFAKSKELGFGPASGLW